MAEELSTRNAFAMIPAEQIKQQVQGIQQLMQSVMINGQHYGKITGCGDKFTLLQPGAQKLMLMFQLADEYNIEQTDLGNGHREYQVKCRLVQKSNGMLHGEGVGMCSTMESKYRYRNVGDYEILNEDIPSDARERKGEYRKQGFGMKNIDGGWFWVKFTGSSKQENPDIADTYNTVLKMACKRALIAAVLNSLAASDIFAQDLEDLPHDEAPEAAPQPSPAQKELGEKMREASKVGIKVADIKSWVGERFGRDVTDLNDYEIEVTVEYIGRLIDNAHEGEAAAGADEIEAEKITNQGNVFGAASLADEDFKF